MNADQAIAKLRLHPNAHVRAGDLADALEEFMKEFGPPPPLHSGEERESEGRPSSTTSTLAHDHLPGQPCTAFCPAYLEQVARTVDGSPRGTPFPQALSPTYGAPSPVHDQLVLRAYRVLAAFDELNKPSFDDLTGKAETELEDAVHGLHQLLYHPAESLAGTPDPMPVTDDASFDFNARRLDNYDAEFHARVHFARMAGQRLYGGKLRDSEQEALTNGAVLGAYAMVLTAADMKVRDEAWIDRYLTNQMLVTPALADELIVKLELQPHAWTPGNGRNLDCTLEGCGRPHDDPIHGEPGEKHPFEKQYVHGQPVEECGREGCGLWVDNDVHAVGKAT